MVESIAVVRDHIEEKFAYKMKEYTVLMIQIEEASGYRVEEDMTIATAMVHRFEVLEYTITFMECMVGVAHHTILEE
jgi:hypothetical protein